MAGRAASAILSGTTEVPTPKTAVRLVTPLQSPKFDRQAIGVWVVADSANTEPVVVGDATVQATVKGQNGIVLSKTAPAIFIEVADPTTLWVDAITAKDKLSWVILYR